MRNSGLNLVVAATEVSDLNMQSTRLQQQLVPLTSRTEQLRQELQVLQEQVSKKRDERTRNAPKNVEQMKLELDKLQKELEVQ